MPSVTGALTDGVNIGYPSGRWYLTSSLPIPGGVTITGMLVSLYAVDGNSDPLSWATVLQFGLSGQALGLAKSVSIYGTGSAGADGDTWGFSPDSTSFGPYSIYVNSSSGPSPGSGATTAQMGLTVFYQETKQKDFYVRSGGVWKPVDPLYVRVGGVWKEPTQLYTRSGGVWKKVYGT